MINTKKLLITAFASYPDYHQVIYIYENKRVNLCFDVSDDLCDEFDGKMSQWDALQVAQKNEENKSVRTERDRIMNSVAVNYYAK